MLVNIYNYKLRVATILIYGGIMLVNFMRGGEQFLFTVPFTYCMGHNPLHKVTKD